MKSGPFWAVLGRFVSEIGTGQRSNRPSSGPAPRQFPICCPLKSGPNSHFSGPFWAVLGHSGALAPGPLGKGWRFRWSTALTPGHCPFGGGERLFTTNPFCLRFIAQSLFHFLAVETSVESLGPTLRPQSPVKCACQAFPSWPADVLVVDWLFIRGPSCRLPGGE